jgi:hypothetical protein
MRFRKTTEDHLKAISSTSSGKVYLRDTFTGGNGRVQFDAACAPANQNTRAAYMMDRCHSREVDGTAVRYSDYNDLLVAYQVFSDPKCITPPASVQLIPKPIYTNVSACGFYSGSNTLVQVISGGESLAPTAAFATVATVVGFLMAL